MHVAFASFVLALGTVAACNSNGPTMRPGENCIGCHTFSAAGTVFPSEQSAAKEGIGGVTVTIVDASQKTVRLNTNSAGNFYTNDAIAWPANITLTLGSRTASMDSAPHGACATCHGTDVPGRVSLP